MYLGNMDPSWQEAMMKLVQKFQNRKKEITDVPEDVACVPAMETDIATGIDVATGTRITAAGTIPDVSVAETRLSTAANPISVDNEIPKKRCKKKKKRESVKELQRETDSHVKERPVAQTDTVEDSVHSTKDAQNDLEDEERPQRNRKKPVRFLQIVGE